MKLTLCGSTRFASLFEEWNLKLTFAGHIVYSCACFGKEANALDKDHCVVLTDDQKNLLDLVHFAKIEESDGIVVINKDDYIGFSTRREILWARMRGKKIFYTERRTIHNVNEAWIGSQLDLLSPAGGL